MKKNIQSVILLLVFSFPFICFSQEQEVKTETDPKIVKIRPIRIGAKVGFPNIIGGNIEYVTPVLNNKLGFNLDYSQIKSDWLGMDNEEEYGDKTSNFDFRYIEPGISFYFFKPGKGLYTLLSYGMFQVDGTIRDVSHFEDSDLKGTGTIDLSHNSFNVKLGAKLGGLFYFRPEVGYSFNSLPQSAHMDVLYEDGSRERKSYEFEAEGTPYSPLFSGLNANLGIGFAF